MSAGPAAAGAGAAAMQRPAGCMENTLAANDDGSTAEVALGFTAFFQGDNYTKAFVNNNGNVTFGSSLSQYTPQPIGSLGIPIIAAFWADVDTRVAATAKYGTTTYQGHPAFCVEWDGVGYFAEHDDKLNKFELILVSRPDRAAGDFDIVFNYDQIKWETGDASGGSEGLGGTPPRVGFGIAGGGSSELSGSGTNGAFLDSGPAALVTHNENSGTAGRYVFPVVSGQPQGEPGLHGLVSRHNEALVGAQVQACPQDGGVCHITQTNGQGRYSFPSLPSGLYSVLANPPANDPISLPTKVGPVQVSGSVPVVRDIVMNTLSLPPSGTVVGGFRTFGGGVPVIEWHESTPLETHGCAGANPAQWEVVIPANSPSGEPKTIQSGFLSETSSGTYKGSIPSLAPFSGFAQIRITLHCPAPAAPEIGAFDVYIDPSGHVVDTTGDAIEGATVTLLRSDSESGPFGAVPDGSSIMSPNNRSNPSTTDAAGRFGWDVISGFYVVQATKPGCADPNNPTSAATSTGVLPVPPPVTDLRLTLNCDPLTGLTAAALRNGKIAVSFQPTGDGSASASATTSFKPRRKKAKKGGKHQKGKGGKAKAHGSAFAARKGKNGHGKKKGKHRGKGKGKRLRTIAYGRAATAVSGLQRVTFIVSPTRRAWKLLKQRKRLRVPLTVAFASAAGGSATKSASVQVRYVKPKGKKKHPKGKGRKGKHRHGGKSH
jgi:hypothetical protein